MGDVLTLIEKAQANVDEEKAKELEQKNADSFVYAGRLFGSAWAGT
jgi:signal recognition particle GTPase